MSTEGTWAPRTGTGLVGRRPAFFAATVGQVDRCVRVSENIFRRSWLPAEGGVRFDGVFADRSACRAFEAFGRAGPVAMSASAVWSGLPASAWLVSSGLADGASVDGGESWGSAAGAVFEGGHGVRLFFHVPVPGGLCQAATGSGSASSAWMNWRWLSLLGS